MTAITETTDHDAGLPPLILPAIGFLVPVLLDGHRWAMVPPGDPIAQHLVDGEGSSNEAG